MPPKPLCSFLLRVASDGVCVMMMVVVVVVVVVMMMMMIDHDVRVRSSLSSCDRCACSHIDAAAITQQHVWSTVRSRASSCGRRMRA